MAPSALGSPRAARTAARGLPAGFVRVRESSVVGTVDSALLAYVRDAGLLEPGAAERRLAEGGFALGRAPTARLTLPGAHAGILLRSVRHGGMLGPWLGGALLGLGRPLAELTATAALRAGGAPVPRPALMIGQRRVGPLWSAVIGTWIEESAVDGVAFLAGAPDRNRRLRAAGAAGGAVRRFHDAGGVHADLHVKNLLVREIGEEVDVVIVDLDRARVVARVSPAERMKELMRLYRSLRKRGLLAAVGERACVAFFHTYVDGDRALRRALLERLPRERARIALHAWRYPAR